MSDRADKFDQLFSIKGRSFFSNNPDFLVPYMKDLQFDKQDINIVHIMIILYPQELSEILSKPNRCAVDYIAYTISKDTSLERNIVFSLIADINGLNGCSPNIISKTASDNDDIPFTKKIIKWHIDGDNILHISGNGAIPNFNEFDKKPWGDEICGAVIEGGITSIGNFAFSKCLSLSSIMISNSVTSIGKGAFLDCRSLKTITIPNNVAYIGKYAFYYCSSLESIVLPNGIASIEDSLFCNCSSIKSINIPDSVISIGTHAFDNCASLTSIIIPNSVTSIENYAICNCTSLESIIIPDSVTSIDRNIFYGCQSLRLISIPSNIFLKDWNFIKNIEIVKRNNMGAMQHY